MRALHGRKLVTAKPQTMLIQAVFKMVELDKTAVLEDNAEVLSAEVPKLRDLNDMMTIEQTDFFR